jgi:hypothetical protein
MAIVVDRRVRSADRAFFSGMGILIAAIVLVGFAPTFYLRGYLPLPAYATSPLSALLVAHGIVATLWLLLFVAQTLLVAVGRTDLHRRLGVLAALVAAVTIVLAGAATIDGLRRGVALPGFDPRVWWLGNTFPSVPLLAFLIGVAIVLRRRPETHKRLMLLAAINLLPPAVARIALRTLDPSFALTFSSLMLLGFVVVLVIYDLVTRGRVHPVSLWGGAATMLLPQIMNMVARTPAGLAFADLIR